MDETGIKSDDNIVYLIEIPEGAVANEHHFLMN